MPSDPGPDEERQRRLRHVRSEIQRELAQGVTVSADDWLRKYPELMPDLGVMLHDLMERGTTQVAAGPGVDTLGASETISRPPDVSA